MKNWICALIVLAATGHSMAAPKEGILIVPNYYNAPISLIADNYGEWLDKQVVVAPGAHVAITVKSDDKLTLSQALNLIGLAITNAGVEIVETEPGKITFQPARHSVTTAGHVSSAPSGVATTTNASMRHSERRLLIFEPQDTTNSAVTNFSKLSPEMLKHLREYQQEVLRQGLQPLPIPLPPITNSAPEQPVKKP